jgi:hypothetical protein
MDTIRSPISWRRLARAVEYYESAGYVQVEVPWRVTGEIVWATAPAGATPFITMVNHGGIPNKVERPDHLVGSAESGFLAIMEDLKPGYYYSISPCFRDNEEDDLHFCDFMKLELCIVNPSSGMESRAGLAQMISTCLRFFDKEYDRPFDYEQSTRPKVVRTKDGFDIEANGIELGSYGFREVTISGITNRWIYGTGLAEPRFSQVYERSGG